MRALVTGGSGFLGSHLCDALLADGYNVIAVDNLLTGRAENVRHLANDARFELQQADIIKPFDFGKVDYVFHFASPASPVDYTEWGIETLQVGSLGTFNALDAAQRYGAKFFFASTSECYGDPLEHPQRETYWGNVNPIGPRSVYDEGKRFSEAAVMAYHRYRKLDTHIVRIFNTYGPRMQINDGRVVPNFMKQAICGQDLTIYGDGSQTRSFCYVGDEIEGIMRLARSSEHLPVNIGNPHEFTMLECAQVVLQVTGSKSKLRFEPLPQDDPKQRRPDITKARALLGWEPKVTLEEGLRLSLTYFKEAVQKQAAAQSALHAR
ncbi:MAG TPA: UDP-glucuronic acid decarboxylase family protein [Terriglobales bacterium]|nr:UDP-glucuronic acid decarboxylase family protein [Terriglobales bacterium]